MAIEIYLPISKSIYNRQLILQFLLSNVTQHNLSDLPNDVVVLNNALLQMRQATDAAIHIDIEDAGTAFRFITALACTQVNKHFVIDGTNRLQQRPIKPLVDALVKLGADISYLEKEGFAPLLIKGSQLIARDLELEASISSQFITAILLISPAINKHLTIQLKGEIVSFTYIEQTIELLNYYGVVCILNNDKITIKPSALIAKPIFIEYDWSAAAFFYAALVVSTNKRVVLKHLSFKNLQGDKYAAQLFELLGIASKEIEQGVLLSYDAILRKSFYEIDLINYPDLAQAFIVAASFRKLKFKVVGLSTLLNKETNRLLALKTELAKCNVKVVIITNNVLDVDATLFEIKDNTHFLTYNDHRMAMSFAIYKLVNPTTIIENEEVVKKSFPNFWQQFNKLV